MSSIFVAGLDLGQTSDYSALVIVQAKGTSQTLETNEPIPKQIYVETMPLVQLDIGHVERFPLGTAWQTIADRMAARCARMKAPRYLAIDKTGVGSAPCEMMEALSPVRITITGGDQVMRVSDQEYRVPKRDLVSVPQVALQNHVLRIGKSVPFADLLIRELLAFRFKISLSGHDTYEAWREAEHDDLVLALSIASWVAQTVISMQAVGIMEAATVRPFESQISPY